ncbi:MAG: sigma-70 family RNA polymerase sigma factor [Acidobacteria bacterium]|nr:sigma-70 family RNA polymerase sigma factor [Acidobacteriota bacterium]
MSRAYGMDNRGWVVPQWTLTVSSPDEAGNPRRPPEAASDTELVALVHNGSPEAFDLIVERHRRGVYQLCYRYAGRHEDAADLAQDVFLRAYRGLGRFKGEASLRTWLYRIAVNTALNRLASRAPRLEQMEPLDAVERADTRAEAADDAMLRRERARQVRSAIARLPARQRATLVLRVYQELSHEEIAQVLGSSVGACKANLFHALNRLRTLLQP